MERNFRVVRACATEAIRDFSWREFAPFGWILAVQLVFLLLALNMQSPVAMGSLGAAVRLFEGDAPVHYPRFFLYLPRAASMVEAFLYTIVGAVLVPLSLIRIFAPMDSTLASGGVGTRLRKAILPSLISLSLGLLLLIGWQELVGRALAPTLRAALPGFAGAALIWVLSVLGAYAITAILLYIPVVAIGRGVTLRESLQGGIAEGAALFLYTLLFIVIFSLPALPLLLATQILAGFIVDRLRPELIAVVLAAYAITISVATYLTYAAAARLHWAGQQSEGS